jgi:hypothetical protein
MCPECGGTDVRRSRRRNLLERVWSWLGIWPYRCFQCTARFFQPYVGDSAPRPQFDRRSAPELLRRSHGASYHPISRAPMQKDLTRLHRGIAGSGASAPAEAAADKTTGVSP